MGIYRQGAVSIDRYLMDWAKTGLTVSQGSTIPATGELGQLFWRSSTGVMYRHNGTGWVTVSLDSVLFDFDAHAQPEAYPDNDFVGQRAYMVEAWTNSWRASVLIGVAVFTDRALYRHRSVMDSLFEAFQPTKRIPLLNLSDGTDTGSALIVRDEVMVMPMAKVDNRPIQFISVDFEADNSFSSQQ